MGDVILEMDAAATCVYNAAKEMNSSYKILDRLYSSFKFMEEKKSGGKNLFHRVNIGILFLCENLIIIFQAE